MKGIDIIIPVHKYDESTEALLTRCLASVKDMAIEAKNVKVNTDIIIIGPSLPSESIMKLVEVDVFASFNVVDNNTDATDFCSQVNLAVKEHCSNDYFMVVEYDDMVTPKWIKAAVPYIHENKKTSVFLPLVEAYDFQSPNTPIHYINEIGWSSSFVENELGFINLDALKTYCNFNITGSIIKKNDFIKAGCYKPSIKLSFGYELLMRMTNLYGDAFVIPKVGYYHFVNREDSLTSEYHRTMSQEEGSWWIKLAGQEYHFKKDRNKTYSPDEEEE